MKYNFKCKKLLVKFCIFIIYPTLFLNAQDELIEAVHVTKNRVDIIINKEFKKQYHCKSDFFVEYEDPDIDLTKLDYSVITMPLFMNLITLIWASGRQYYIDSMDSNLYSSLIKVKEVFKRLYPATQWDGNLVPRKVIDNTNNFLQQKKDDSEIALLFSHGLDSITTSLRHADKKQLLITAWGHFDSPLNKQKLWYKFKKLVLNFGQKFNCKNTFLRSNYHTFIDFKYLEKNITPEITKWRLEAVEGLGWVGLVAPILLSKGYTKFYIAATYCWDNPYPQAAHPIIDHNIKFADISVVHDAFELTRAEKNEYIEKECARRKIDNLFLRVCQRTSDDELKNCCNCEKCFRTITGFLIIEKDLQKFGFQIEKEKAINKIKDFFASLMTRSKLDDRTSCYWREFQYFAQKKLSKSRGLYREFLKWLIDQNIDKMTTYRPVSRVDWSSFVNLYDAIPQRFLEK